MQSHDADAATACFGEGQLDEVRSKVAAAVFGLDVNIEQVTAAAGLRIEGMGRPVEQKQTRTGDHFAIVFAEPAKVFALGDGLRDPGLVRLGHEFEDLIVAAAGVDEHAAAMVSDERSVGGRGRPRLQHDQKYRA